MKTESVLARPFFRMPLESVDAWLNAIEVRIGDDDEFSLRESVTISVSARTCPPHFRIPAVPAKVLDSDSSCDMQLTITLSDEGRKMQKVLLSARLAEIGEGAEIECTIPPGIDWTSPQGAILSLLLCTANRAPKAIGIPFRKSSTVGARHIGVNRAAPGDDFPIHYLSDKQFKERGYHPKALAVVVISSDDLNCETIEEANIMVLVHEEVKGALAFGCTSKRGRLATQAVMETVTNQIAFVAFEGEYPDGTLGSRTRGKLKKKLGMSCFDNAQTLRAATQGAFQLVELLKKQ